MQLRALRGLDKLCLVLHHAALAGSTRVDDASQRQLQRQKLNLSLSHEHLHLSQRKRTSTAYWALYVSGLSSAPVGLHVYYLGQSLACAMQPWNADDAQIKKAYYAMMRECHPDLSQTDESQEFSTIINEIYEVQAHTQS